MDIWDFLIGLFIVINIAGLIFWGYMFIDCNQHETGRLRMRWIVILLLTQPIGALIYYFNRYKKRVKLS